MPLKGNFKIISFAFVVLLCLVSCRAEEQDRLLSYDPGIFKGKNTDKPLSAKNLAELRQRGLLQSN
jgi:hypothetical protein